MKNEKSPIIAIANNRNRNIHGERLIANRSQRFDCDSNPYREYYARLRTRVERERNIPIDV